MKIKKFIFRFFLWIFAIAALCLVILIGIAAFYEKTVGNLVINELKKSLKTELNVETAQLSLIWSFPNASVSLKNVRLKGNGKNGKELIKADDISLSCGIFGLISGHYVINRIEINNAKLFVDINKDGKGNYDIFKTDEKEQEPSKLDLSIKNARLRNVKLEYNDDRFRHNIRLTVINSNFAGNFKDERYDLSSDAKMISEQIAFGDDIYFQGKELGYEAVIDIDHKTATYSFKKFNLDLQGNILKSEGNIRYLKDGLKMDLILNSDKAKLGPLLRLLPNSLEKSFGGFQSNADMNFTAAVNGVYNARSMPKTDIKFGLKEGKVTHPLMAGYLKAVSFDAVYKHPGGSDKKDGRFRLDNFKGSISGNPIGLEIEVTGTENPLIEAFFNAKIPLKSVYGFFGKSAGNGSGEVEIEALKMKGKLNDIVNPRNISRVELGGKINFDAAAIELNDIPLSFERGTLSLEDNVLDIKDLFFKSKETQIVANGSLENLLAVICADSLNSKAAELEFDLSFKSEKINVDELLKAFTNPVEIPQNSTKSTEELTDSIAVSKNENRAFLTNFLFGKINTKCKELVYGKIVAINISSLLVFENNVLKIMGAKTNVFKGNLGFNAKINFDKEPSMLAFFDCENVDMYELLDQTDNFGQTTLTSKNLRGQLNSVVKINAYWDSTANFNYDKLDVIADLSIKKGELINFELMKSLGAYVKMKDLNHIKFNELKNQLYIRKQELVIPAMFIQSNAINLLLAGKHGFNQDFDFKMKINAGQVVAQKMKKFNSKLPMIPAKQKGLFNIYCSVYGNIEKAEYNYKLGKKHAKKQLVNDLKQQTNQLNNSLMAEFEKSDLFNGKNAVVDAESITEKINKTIEPEGWEDDGDEDL